jgi:hypothetical protein
MRSVRKREVSLVITFRTISVVEPITGNGGGLLLCWNFITSSPELQLP